MHLVAKKKIAWQGLFSVWKRSKNPSLYSVFHTYAFFFPRGGLKTVIRLFLCLHWVEPALFQCNGVSMLPPIHNVFSDSHVGQEAKAEDMLKLLVRHFSILKSQVICQLSGTSQDLNKGRCDFQRRMEIFRGSFCVCVYKHRHVYTYINIYISKTWTFNRDRQHTISLNQAFCLGKPLKPLKLIEIVVLLESTLH